LPDHVGVSIGEGTPYKTIAYEWHYLLNKQGQLQLPSDLNKFTDHSGVKLKLTPDLRQHSAASFGMMDMRMQLPPGVKDYEWVITTEKDRIARMLEDDFASFGSLHPVAVHLHEHSHGRSAHWEHLRDGKTIGSYGMIDKYKGFGTDESFFMVDPKGDTQHEANVQEQKRGHFHWTEKQLALRKGDVLRMHCVYDTRCKFGADVGNADCEKATEPIVYGLSHGQEMCGFLMMYYPHDPARRMRYGMLLGGDMSDLYHTPTLTPSQRTEMLQAEGKSGLEAAREFTDY